MIATLRGELLSRKPGQVVVDVRGVGYELSVSARTYDLLPSLGEECFLYVYTQVREDALSLYGFAAPEEKELFLLLNTVSGVGPRLALAILSAIDVAEFCESVRMKNLGRLTAISGVGKKTAQRLCMELGEKVGGLTEQLPVQPQPVASTTAVEDTVMEDAASALVNLGYPQNTAWQVLRNVQQQHAEDAAALPVEELVRLALRALA